jgi:hypothetical protein
VVLRARVIANVPPARRTWARSKVRITQRSRPRWSSVSAGRSYDAIVASSFRNVASVASITLAILTASTPLALFPHLHVDEDFAPPIDLANDEFVHVGPALALRFRHAGANVG